MASFKPESEVFEITDFTNATEWEAFTSRLEKILHSLGVANKELVHDDTNTSSAHIETHEVTLRSYKFSVTVMNAEACGESDSIDVQFALEDGSDDFPSRTHCLTRWFGLRKLVVLSPAGDPPPFNVSDASLATQLLSSLAVAAGQTKCTLPLFVQVQRSDRRMYDGVWLSGDGLRTDFSVLHLRKTPNQYGHLSGLMDIFKAEMNLVTLPPTIVSIRFTYLLNSWPSAELFVTDKSLCKLAVGGSCATLQSLQLSATWPSVREDSVVDNALYSDLDPAVAPHWSIRSLFGDSDSRGSPLTFQLSGILMALLQLCQRHEKVNELLGRHAFQEDEPSAELQENVRQALKRMTSPAMHAPTLSSLVRSAVTSSALEDSPLEKDMLDYILLDIFPDIGKDLSLHGGQDVDGGTYDTASSRVLFRSCPKGSLLVRIACTMIRVFCEHGGVRALAYVWREIVLELRRRYDNDILILNVPRKCAPDMRYSLLQQKLQMLQCCIEHKRQRVQRECESREKRRCSQQAAASASLTIGSSGPQGNEAPDDVVDGSIASEDSSDEDEFFEAVEEQETSESSIVTKDSDDEEQDGPTNERADTQKAEGVLEVSPNLCLLVSGRPLNIPITQEVTPMTEDMLAEQQEMLAGLGTTDVARQLRARMQCNQLLADMEAFKAANPGCILGDFVRWYSPRDWIETPSLSSADDVEPVNSDNEHASAGSDEHESCCPQGQASTPPPEEAQGDWDVVSGCDVAVATSEVDDPDTAEQPPDDVPSTGVPAVDNATPAEAESDDDNYAENHVDELPIPAPTDTAEYTVKGHLSIRMRDPSTLWHQTWTSALPVPAHRQRRLFDDTLEAEKVFQFLEKLTIGQLMLHVAPIVIEQGMEVVQSLPEARFDAVLSSVESASASLARVFQTTADFLPQLSDAIRHLCEAETRAVRICALVAALRFGKEQYHGSEKATGDLFSAEQLDAWVADLVALKSLELEKVFEHPLGLSLRGLATVQVKQQQQQQEANTAPEMVSLRHEAVRVTRFPSPAAREFIIRNKLPRPSVNARPTMQRIFAVLAANEFRLATALSTDMTYM